MDLYNYKRIQVAPTFYDQTDLLSLRSSYGLVGVMQHFITVIEPILSIPSRVTTKCIAVGTMVTTATTFSGTTAPPTGPEVNSLWEKKKDLPLEPYLIDLIDDTHSRFNPII
jgi:hypothetical protein